MQLVDGRLSLSPSDVTAYLACEHLTTLSLRVARGELELPGAENEQAELVFRKGREHEQAYLDRLRAAGKDVVEINLEPDHDWARAARDTEAAIAAGVDVVYQGVLVADGWRGVADFLERQPDGSYEALDTKLARSAKPAYILQLCFYSEQLARIQGREPRLIHVLLGNGEQQSFRPQEFAAYARRVRRRLEAFVAAGAPTEPWPNDHCGICEFLPVCDAWWDETDSLSRVAGLWRRHVDDLRAAGITTLAQLARANPAEPPAGVNPETFAKLQRQAELQLHRRETGELRYVLLEPQPGHGLAQLPDPSPGDLFFDLEGNPFWDEQGSLEYLWGILDTDGRYTALWADDHASERRALEQAVDLIHARLADHPDLHVYHYAAYEVAVLRRLMGRYGTREAEIDDLLRRGVFVDLLKVVRGLAASVPGYGLKEMEAFLAFHRTAPIRDGGTSIVEYERFVQTRDRSILDAIAAYNEEDCAATRALRDWLLDRRAEALARFGPFPLPEPEEPREPKPEKLERVELREALLEAGHELAAELLDYHERERKPVWWAFFDRIEQTPEELVDDGDSIGLLEPLGEPEQRKRSWLHRFRYPPQEHKLKVGQAPFDETGAHAGTIVELDREACRITLLRGPKLAGVELPQALLPGEPYRTDAHDDALARLGRSLLAGDRRYPAAESILAREPFGRDVQTTDLDEMAKLVLSLDGRHLVIQGPPGSGKTWVSGRLIARLLGEGKRVGVASTSHKAIHKLLAEVEAAGIDVEGVKKATAGNPESFYESDHIRSECERKDCLDAPLTGGTSFFYAHGDLDGTVDYLFVDEAGQVSLADAVAMATCARNVVLVGDPQQLAQVTQGTHPVGAGASVLQHLLAGHRTIPPDRGLFLERTFRLHPDVCAYVSEEFYEGRLVPDPVTETRTTPLGTGLRWLPVEHEACRQESRAEADRVQKEVERLLAAGLAPDELMVVVPYNAQVNLLRDLLPPEVPVGTVDKFQGQQAKVVLYSLTSSSGEDVPRGLEFLLSRNRLNVAISRAQCLAYLVCSPRLLEVNCRTVEQMRLANALCRFVELAGSGDPAAGGSIRD
ncbi:MAG TPA: TM0106 family RecB-like putative nuclease [Gaiellaceae bacterium]|nr:TM0106 family RecB-like putative nuclease [Gaiellaceae bacterium]